MSRRLCRGQTTERATVVSVKRLFLLAWGGGGVTYREQRHKIQSKEPDDSIDEAVQIPLQRSPQRPPSRPSTRTTQSPPRSAKSRAGCRPCELDSLFNGSDQIGWVCASDCLDGGAVLEDDEGGHGAYAVLRGDVPLVVDVDLGEGDALGLRIFGREGFKRRRDHLARATPVGIDCRGGDMLVYLI